MPTIVTQQVVSDVLERGRRLDVTVSGNGAGRFQRLYGSPAEVVEVVLLTSGASRSFGEYLVDIPIRLYCTAGTITYTKAQSLAEQGGGGSVDGTADVPGLDPILTDLDARVSTLRAVLTGIKGGSPSTVFVGVVGVSGGAP